MNKHIPCEADLNSSVSKTLADAVMCCKTNNPYCGADGRCHADGSCFINQEMTLEQAKQEILHLCNTINEQKTLHNFDILKSIYELLISTINDHNLSDLMKHHFVKTEVFNKD